MAKQRKNINQQNLSLKKIQMTNSIDYNNYLKNSQGAEISLENGKKKKSYLWQNENIHKEIKYINGPKGNSGAKKYT